MPSAWSSLVPFQRQKKKKEKKAQTVLAFFLLMNDPFMLPLLSIFNNIFLGFLMYLICCYVVSILMQHHTWEIEAVPLLVILFTLLVLFFFYVSIIQVILIWTLKSLHVLPFYLPVWDNLFLCFQNCFYLKLSILLKLSFLKWNKIQTWLWMFAQEIISFVSSVC